MPALLSYFTLGITKATDHDEPNIDFELLRAVNQGTKHQRHGPQHGENLKCHEVSRH